MPSVKIDIKDAIPWIKEFSEDFRKAAERGVISAGQKIVSKIQTEVIPSEPRMPVDRGIYKAAWRADPIEKGVFVNNTSPHAPFIEYGVQAENVSIGRRMLEALAEWVSRKGLKASAGARRSPGPGVAQSSVREPKAPQEDTTVKRIVVKLAGLIARKRVGGVTSKGPGGRVSLKSTTNAEAMSIAWAIAKDMQKRGIFDNGKGLRILEKALRNVNEVVKEEIEREIAKLK